jgi:hypothetical protein
MAHQCVFSESVDMLTRHESSSPEAAQAVQTLHILMTGGPAESPEEARAVVKTCCETLLALVTPSE